MQADMHKIKKVIIIEEFHLARESIKSSVIGLAWSFISRVSSILFYVAGLAILPENEAGLFFIATAAAYLGLSILNLGIPDVIQRFIPYYTGKNQLFYIKPMIKLGVIVSVILIIIFTIAIMLLSDFIFSIYNPAVRPMLPWVLATTALFVLQGVIFMALNGLMLFNEFNFLNGSQNVAKLLLFLAILPFLGANAVTMLIAFISTLAFTVILGVYWVAKKIFRYPGPKTAMPFGEWAKFGLPGYASGYSSMIVDSLPTILLGHYAAASVVAAYNAMLLVATTLMPAVVTPVFSILLPVFSGLFAKSKESLQRFSLHSSRWTFYVALPIVILFIVLAKDIVFVLFPKYISYHWLLYILVPFLSIPIFSRPYATSLIAAGQNMAMFKISIVSLVLSAILNFTLIPVYSFIGAAIEKTLTGIVRESLFIYYAWKNLNIKTHPSAFKSAIACIPLLVISSAVVFLAKPVLNRMETIFFIITISAVSFVAYAITLFYLGGFLDIDYRLFNSFSQRFRFMEPVFSAIMKMRR